jgi:hypothetical protein
MSKIENPHVFPQSVSNYDEHGNQIHPLTIGGMTLRDWFAGQAIMGMVQDYNDTAREAKWYAADAYDIADAMLAERAKTEDEQ